MPTPRIPGPDHPITIQAAPGRVRASYQGHEIADSADVLMLKEADYPAVAYFARRDVDMAYMGRTTKTTHCPYKGEASYYTLSMDGAIAENAVWTYEDPYPAVAAIRDRLAFYPDRVTIEAEQPAAGASIDQVVLHTDAGAGAAQREPWPATAEDPASAI